MIAGAGFAKMAWDLAQHRTHLSTNLRPRSRERASYYIEGPSKEFYRILDQAWQERGRPRVYL